MEQVILYLEKTQLEELEKFKKKHNLGNVENQKVIKLIVDTYIHMEQKIEKRERNLFDK